MIRASTTLRAPVGPAIVCLLASALHFSSGGCSSGGGDGAPSASAAPRPTSSASASVVASAAPRPSASVAAARPKHDPPKPAAGSRCPEGMVLAGKDAGAICIDKTEVTTTAYAACVDAGECPPPDLGALCNWKVEARADHPVNCVAWAQADAYCGFAGKALPTDAEWLLAARGDDARAFPWGADAPGARACWSGVEKRKGTCRAGELTAGAAPSGALDLAGNVWEWTLDKTLRGGAYDATVASAFGAEAKSSVAPTMRLAAFGFRCALPAATAP